MTPAVVSTAGVNFIVIAYNCHCEPLKKAWQSPVAVWSLRDCG